jgi:uncharacterized repeat protein (TIGR02543 family)
MALLFLIVSVEVNGEEETPDNGIPVIYINIDESQGTIEDMIKSPDHSVFCYGTMSIEVPEGFHYSDFPDLECLSVEKLSMSIRGRGNSTWEKNDKKPFKIKLDKKADIFSLGKNKHWVLVANAFDKSLLRDRITAWLGEQMHFEFTPQGVPVDLVLSGEQFGTKYLGSYYLSENVRVDTNRLEIDELKDSDVDMSTISGGYLIQNSLQVRPGSPDRFLTKRGVNWATHTPSFDTEEDNLVQETPEEGIERPLLEDSYENHVQQDYIQDHIQKIEDALFAGDGSYHKLMDMESAAKYWMVNQACLNADAYVTSSTYIYKKRDVDGTVGKLYWGPLWDFDYAWNNRDITTGYLMERHEWIKAMLCDKEEGGFVDTAKKQWPALKAAMEKLIEEGGIIDGYYEETKRSAQQDWIINHENDGPFDYKEEVDALKKWIRDRIDWMDANLDLIDDLAHKVTFVALEEVQEVRYIENGYFLEELDKYPKKEGYTFIGWEDEDGKIMDSFTPVNKDMTLTAKYLSDEEVTHGDDITFRKDNEIVSYNPHSTGYILSYEVFPTDVIDQSVEFVSLNEDYATVDEDGTITYNGIGEVTIRATLKSGKSRDFTLKVVEGSVPDPKKIIVPDTVEMKTGENKALVVTTEPEFAKIDMYEYESDNEEVVDVDSFGVLTAKKDGTAKIKIRTLTGYGDSLVFEKEVTVIVGDAKPKPEPKPEPKPQPTPDKKEEVKPAYRLPLTGIE